MGRQRAACHRKDIWDKVDIVGKVLGALVIPVALAVAGYFFNTALQDRADRQKTVDVAIEVLQSDKNNIPDIKRWALGVLRATSESAGLPLSTEAEEELKTNPLPTSAYGQVVPTTYSSLGVFFDEYRKEFGGTLRQSTVDNLSVIFTLISKDREVTDFRQTAYILATVMYETAGTFVPMTESCPNPLSKGCTEENGRYKGRGYLQLTQKHNYKAIGEVLGVDLLSNPELALDPSVAYEIASIMMIQGRARGHRLDEYINSDKADYEGAREAVDPDLRSGKIVAEKAKIFEIMLKNSLGIE